jgi:hypothetical protein
LENYVEIVAGNGLIAPFKAALHATMADDPLAVLKFGAHGFHESPACCGAIAGIHIHVLAPKAPRAMVRITIPLNSTSTISADKVLFFSLKPPCHVKILPYYFRV